MKKSGGGSEGNMASTNPGRQATLQSKKKRSGGVGTNQGVELKELFQESVPSSSNKIPKSESGRENEILMKARQRSETGTGNDESDQSDPIEVKVVGGRGEIEMDVESNGLLIITPGTSSQPGYSGKLVTEKEEKATGKGVISRKKKVAISLENVGAAVGNVSNRVKNSSSRKPKLTFPQAVEQVRARMKMGNVRRSSAVGNEIRSGTSSPTVPVKRENDENEAADQVIEKEQANEMADNAADIVGAGTVEQATVGVGGEVVRRRHSTGSAIGINGARMMALIRRFQRRRLRPPTQSTAVKYLQYFMAALFYMGMSPLQPASAKKLPKWLLWVQYVCYWTFTAISIVHSLMDVKTTWLDFRANESMLTFVTFGFYLANAFTRIYGATVFITSRSTTSNLLSSIDRVNRQGTPKTGGWPMAGAIFMATFALFLTLCSTVFADAPLDKWTFKKGVQLRAYEMAEFLFLWTAHDYTNSTNELFDEYAGKYTGKVKVFGALMDGINWFGTLHSCILLDLWPVIGIQIFVLQCHFSQAMERTKKENRNGRCPLSIHWRHYKQLQDVSEETNKIFGTLIKLVHLQNLLLFGYFLLEVLKKEPVTAVFIIEGITVLKVSISYYMVQKSAEMNEEYRHCVIECSGCRATIEIDGVEMSVPVLLKDMKRRPIGIGRGDFFVDQAFVLKFVTAVGSIFLLLSDESGEKCACGN